MAGETVSGKEGKGEENKNEAMAHSDGKVETELLTDEVKVKITSDEGKIEMGTKEGFTGLTKEELMVYAKDPYWVRLRWTLFILFWLIWIAMLVASIIIIVQAPKCPSPEPRKWYMKGPVYQVMVENFKDSDDDGTGDLKGVQDSLEYLVDTGVNSVWLSDFTESKNIKAGLGNLSDFKNLVTAAQGWGLKLIVDLAVADVDEAQFWLDLNVDGLNVPTVNLTVLSEVRVLLDNLTDENPESPRVLLTDLTDGLEPDEANALFGENIGKNNVSTLVHFPINKELLQTLTQPLKVEDINDVVNASKLPTYAWPNYALGGKDVSRVASRVGKDMVDGMNMLLFLLPGTPFTYYGEEIAMMDGEPEAGNMQNTMDWNTNGTIKGKVTHYSIYQKLAALRQQESILFGNMETFSAADDMVFGLTRVKRGNPGYLLAINVGDQVVEADVSKVTNMADSVRVAIQSVGLDGVADVEKAGSFPSDKVPLKAKQSIVFTFVPKFEK